MKVALVDADSIVYRCGFAGEVTSLQVSYEDKDGNIGTRGFIPDPDLGSASAQLVAFVKESGCEILDSFKRVDPEPVENVLHSAKHMLEEIKSNTNADKLVVYLSGKDNFRNALATLKPYKGNRDKSTRPAHYDAIRDYLHKYWDAVIVEGEEAEDAISVVVWQKELSNCVVAGIDKDLDQIPGEHYDYVKRVLYTVSDDDAEYAFYKQCLTGDSTDNIGGCYKTGDVKARRLLDGTPRAEWWTAIVETYEESKTKPGCPYADKDALVVALENARLVYLRRSPNEIWSPNPND